MTQRLQIHPVNPQQRLVARAADCLRHAGLIVYPTDSCYAFGCALDDRQSSREITRLRQTSKDHNFTLICRDLAEISSYARIENWIYRLLRAHTPGPYTFILPATRDVPRRLQNPKRKTIGIRIPAHPVPAAILAALGEPIMSSTLILPGSELPMNDPDEIYERLDGEVDLIIDSGSCGVEPSTVVDLTGDSPTIVRRGKGSVLAFE
jgi:tRNA threonylcarbamoyl adenosine modification protein (Sua5/YciO/YrdC/YwlC family)